MVEKLLADLKGEIAIRPHYERTKLSSSARSSAVKIMGVASGMILLLMQP
jgi:hypothetical protein